MVDGGRRVQRRIDEWELNGVEERYMKGWKISKIIHMFTRPLKCPGGGPHKHEIEMDQQQNTRLQLREVWLDEAEKKDGMSVRGPP